MAGGQLTTQLLCIIRNKRLNLALGLDEIERRFVAQIDILFPDHLPRRVEQHQRRGALDPNWPRQ